MAAELGRSNAEKDFIKPCPFCGSEVYLTNLLTPMKMFYCRNREGCGAIVSFWTDACNWEKGTENKLKAWNRRAENG